ncbi:MAG: AMP-binding protein [Ectothiorhodospiraceae bacterium]|nr:AMP-binding protein [Ectothiorhodospiraceae bacterium]
MSRPTATGTTRIRSGDRVAEMSDVRARALRAAGGIVALGARPGDRVAVLMRNDIASFEIASATRLSGTWMVPINWHFHPEEVRYVLEDSGARILLGHGDLLARCLACDGIPQGTTLLGVPTPPEIAAAYGVSSDQAALPPGATDWATWVDAQTPLADPVVPPGSTMLYTSGTTGRPKGVRREPMDDAPLLDFYHHLSGVFGIRAGMRTVMTGPLYHSAPLAYAQVGLRLGCDMLLMPRFDAEGFLALVERERITHCHLVPTMLVRLLRLPLEVRDRYDVSSLESVTHGAAPCPPEVKRAIIEWWGPILREYYGSTECSLIASASSAEWLARPGTVGLPSPGARVEVRDEDGRPVSAGTLGEIWVRLAQAPDFTYHNRDDARREMEHDGLLATGDLGSLDSDGYIYVQDRKKDMVISGGVNIYPAEVEAVLAGHPEVRDCAVFGIPDEEYGESLACAIEREPGSTLDADTVRDWLRGRLASYKVPRVVAFHDALPRLDNGKIYKTGLREPYWRDARRRI